MNELTAGGVLTVVVVFTSMLSLWGLSILLHDVSIADRFWGLGFCLIGVTSLFVGVGWPPRQSLMLALVLAWGLRLSIYLTWRNWGRGEDYRYRAMREEHGSSFMFISLFTVFGIQGALMWVISMPIQAAVIEPGKPYFTIFDGIGLLLWLAGFAFETIGDWQLAHFKKDPANEGQVMDRGLWRYTRHPNYFGEAVLWWGIWFVSCSTEHGPWTLLSPVLMTLLLLRVSGVALLERHLRQSRPAYRDYIERTNAFFPGRPKKLAE